ncbi:Ger(x)C family spore germination protein [Tumebacillus sp. ITR2]|uniref:Ger(X)C family spore germination protein n=1 Tax=Tumebacillus amylolyticus TaxID=2801339 RepID=A0ABS1J7J0_9BACL|nr:Ger(x)C family spore germination protein [Tumebacillus amylolyticus]MBL0386219.1 Ger(x)C family spore germination protein [Tumebacillus amylolyticus]
MKSSLWSRQGKKLLILLLLVPFFSGCWDRLEIEERANVLGISIDVEGKQAEHEEGEISHLKGRFPTPTNKMVRITAQIAVPGRIPLGPGGGATGGGGSGDQKPVWVVSVVGHTLDDAMMNLQQQLADRVFLSHLRVIILSEEYARQGVDNVNEYLRRNPEVRRAAWMFVSKGRAADTMQISPELERVPALYLMATLDHAVALGKFPNDFLGIFWSATSTLGQQPYLPYITIKEKNNIQIAGMAYFKGFRMVGIAKPLEIGFFMAVQGLNPGGYMASVPVPGSNESVMVRAEHRKSKIKVDLQNGRPHVTVNVYYEAGLDEKSSSNLQVDNSEILQKIEESASQGAKKAIVSLIKQTQEDEADIFGFGEQVRGKESKYWDENIQTQEKWCRMYKDIPVDVTVSSKIRRVGMTAR